MSATTQRSERIDDPLLGATIGGRYEIVGLLGRGGVGVVYEALQRRLGRTVAIKVMHQRSSSDATSLKRFKREATAISGLGHPNVVDIYDVDRLDDGRPYLVMPKLAGRDLRTELDERGPMTIERAVELLHGPANALDVMHREGVVHRDIKPGNLVLETLPTGQDIVKIVDFGHAWLMDPTAPRLTREGHVVGTARYLSPEAARGEPVDGRADVYSLACVIFELLTGGPPIDEPSAYETLIKKARSDAPSIASRGVAVPPGVEAAIARGLSRQRSLRHATAGDLIADVQRALGGEPTRDPTPVGPQATVIVAPELRALPRGRERQLATEVVHRLERTSESVEVPMHRTRWPLVVTALAGLGLFALVLGSTLGDEAAPPPERAVAPPSTPPAPPAPEVIAEPVAIAIEPTAPIAPTPPRDAPRRVIHASPAPELSGGAAPHVDAAAAARLTHEGMRALTNGLVPDAVRHFAAATVASPRYTPAWRGLGLANQRLGRPAEARRAYERYLALAPDARDAAEIRRRLGEL